MSEAEAAPGARGSAASQGHDAAEHEQDRLIELPNGPVRVRVRGAGPALVWSHGVFFPTEVDDHSVLAHELRHAPGFTLVRYDARGHGRTPPAARAELHRWDRLADDVLALADALGLERFALGGISMGAAVALHAALARPERVTAMLLFALPTAWETRPAEQARYRELLETRTPEALAARVKADLDGMFTPETLTPALRAMVQWLRHAPWTALERIVEGAAASDMPDRRALAGLDVPTLLRPWPNDAGHPLSTAELLAATLPRADLALLRRHDDAPGIRGALAELRALVGGA
ncbi:MAG: alpha/beta fold hydrolase [Polyangiaceae bacterium]|nr:alpha/beta fold hydrolase [Polyangiaceae bacterium]